MRTLDWDLALVLTRLLLNGCKALSAEICDLSIGLSDDFDRLGVMRLLWVAFLFSLSAKLPHELTECVFVIAHVAYTKIGKKTSIFFHFLKDASLAEPHAIVLLLRPITLKVVQEKLLATLITKEGWISVLGLFLIRSELIRAESGGFKLPWEVCFLLKVLVDAFVQDFVDKAKDFWILFGHLRKAHIRQKCH